MQRLALKRRAELSSSGNMDWACAGVRWRIGLKYLDTTNSKGYTGRRIGSRHSQ